MYKVATETQGCMDAIRSITICKSFVDTINSIEYSMSRLPFLMKLSFSKWSDIRQLSTKSSKLQLNITPCKSRLFHDSKYALPTVEFSIARTTLQSTSSGGTSWALWEIKDVVTEAIDLLIRNLMRPITEFRNQLRVIHGNLQAVFLLSHGKRNTRRS
ncbi:uncharacterized protein LOC112688524 [Sipha flava]|uniref:Uncharacterized protein LOC112688524 n=1 Tax=Sipha flava TaxID=143950 RepID=A0A8B8G4P3_9HEMI|nr:uncharacterized protein LOC112688524 [Sipha flava]